MRARVRAGLGAAVLVCSAIVVQAPAKAAPKGPTRWIVTLVPGASVADAIDAAKDVGGKPGVQFTNVVLGFTMSGSPDAAAALAKNPNVVRIFPDGPVRLAQTSVSTGVPRISGPAAHQSGLTGVGATIAVIDSGVDLTHPDLLANLHPTLGKNCLDPPFDALPPQDGNGHGTHVAGIIAAAGLGVTGVAPRAQIVPVQSFDAAGDAHWSNVICGIDYVAAHANEIDVANMSFGDLSTAATSCVGEPTGDFDLLRKAVCRARDAGVVMIAAAGNNRIDANGFVPASFPEVVTVSALTDFDGAPGGTGGLGGCLDPFAILCDDTFAYLFSNFGSVVDVMAPGFEILSTVPGGYALKDGTSMAAPHVSGVAALMIGADPDLTHDEIAYMLRRHGECPDGSPAGADGACAGQGAWAADPDALDEPLVNAERSALAATFDALPETTLTVPSGGVVSGAVALGATATDDRGVAQVAWTVDGTTVSVDTNGADGWSGSWNTAATADGTRTVRAVGTDSGGQTATSAPVSVRVLNHLHVGAVTGTSVAELSTWRASATVTVHDGSHGVVAGATVTVSSSRGGGSCVTGADGRCTVWSNAIPRSVASVTMAVSSLTVPGGARDPAADHVTSVVVSRP